MRGRSKQLLIITVLLSFVTVLLFQNCSDPQQFNTAANKDLRSIATDRFEVPVGDNGAEPIPVNLFLIVDNSNSMKEEQTKLAGRIETLVNALVGYNVDVRVLTTSSLHEFDASGLVNRNAKPNSVWEARVAYRDQAGKKYATARDALDALSVGQYYYEDLNLVLNSKMFAPDQHFFQFSNAMTPAQFATKAALLKNTILNIGTNGDTAESGICSIARVIRESQEDRKILEKGDKAVFLILSDENDFFTPKMYVDRCMSQQIDGYKVIQSQRYESCVDGSCTHVTYQVSDAPDMRYDYSYRWNCPAGTPSECTFSDHVIRPCDKPGYESCSTSGTCTEFGFNEAQDAISSKPGGVVLSCTQGPYGASKLGRIFPISITKEEACANLYDTYKSSVPGSCELQEYNKVEYFNSTELAGRAYKNALDTFGSITPEKAIAQLNLNLNSLLGKGAYQISAIIHDAVEDAKIGCTPTIESTLGPVYRQLVSSLGGGGLINSICAPDYSAPMDGIRDYIKWIVGLTYDVSDKLKSDEVILQVWVRKKDSTAERLLTTDEILITGGTFQILNENAIEIGDTLVVYTEKAPAP